MATKYDAIKLFFANAREDAEGPMEDVWMTMGRDSDKELAEEFAPVLEQYNEGLIAAFELMEKLVWIATRPTPVQGVEPSAAAVALGYLET